MVNNDLSATQWLLTPESRKVRLSIVFSASVLNIMGSVTGLLPTRTPSLSHTPFVSLSQLAIEVMLGFVILGGGRDGSTWIVVSVIDIRAKVLVSSPPLSSTVFAVGLWVKCPCLVLMAMPLDPPLFPNPRGNCSSFPPLGQ